MTLCAFTLHGRSVKTSPVDLSLMRLRPAHARHSSQAIARVELSRDRLRTWKGYRYGPCKSTGLTNGVDLNAVAQELRGGRGHDVVRPVVILTMTNADRWMM